MMLLSTCNNKIVFTYKANIEMQNFGNVCANFNILCITPEPNIINHPLDCQQKNNTLKVAIMSVP